MTREGLDETDKEQIKQEVVKMALYALRRAKQKAPVDTGRLRASITLADSDGLIQSVDDEAFSSDAVDPASSSFGVVLGTNVFYARVQEFGSVNQSPQPFLRPAVQDAFNRFDIDGNVELS